MTSRVEADVRVVTQPVGHLRVLVSFHAAPQRALGNRSFKGSAERLASRELNREVCEGCDLKRTRTLNPGTARRMLSRKQSAMLLADAMLATDA